MTATFNNAQLATYEQARALRETINALSPPIDGGIAPETDDPTTSGIYHPLWLGGPASFPEPNYTDDLGNVYYPLMFRFVCGAGNNVGLIADQAKRHAAPAEPGTPPNPPNWVYAFGELRKAVDEYIANQG